jgi:hypothetical protein
LLHDRAGADPERAIDENVAWIVDPLYDTKR